MALRRRAFKLLRRMGLRKPHGWQAHDPVLVPQFEAWVAIAEAHIRQDPTIELLPPEDIIPRGRGLRLVGPAETNPWAV